MGVKRYTAEERSDILERYSASGLSREEFCEREGVSKSALYRWEGRAGASRRGFVELPVNRAHSIELELPHGVRLKIIV